MQLHGVYSYTFDYKINGTSRWITAETKLSSSSAYGYTYKNLEEGKTYDLRVVVADTAGNTLTSSTKTQATVDSTRPEKPKLSLNGTKGNDEWYRSNIMANITPGKDTGSGIWGIGYELYKKNTRTESIKEPGGSVTIPLETETRIMWQPNIETRSTHSVQITEDGIYRIRVWTIDKQGKTSQVVEKEIKKDATLASYSKVKLWNTGKGDGVGAKTVSVSVTGSDAMTGISAYYFDYKIHTSSSWSTQRVEKTSERYCEYEYRGLKENTNYDFRVRLVDKAGNITKPDQSYWLNATTHKANYVPEISTYVKEKTLTSLTIGVNAKDANYDLLTYDLYFGATDITELLDGKPTETKTEIAGREVFFTMTGLSKYTDYAWAVQVSDGLRTTYATERILESSGEDDPIRSVPILGKTMCDGLGLYCAGTSNELEICTVCNGSGWSRLTPYKEKCTNTNCYKLQQKVPNYQDDTQNYIMYNAKKEAHTSSLEARHYELTNCKACDGTGGVYKNPCTTCRGKGKLIVLKPCDHHMMEDHDCCVHEVIGYHGNPTEDGRDYNIHNLTCSGKVKETITCENCRGNGYKLNGNIKTTCTECNGKGKFDIEKACKHGYYLEHTYMGSDEHDIPEYFMKMCSGGIASWCCGPINEYETCSECNGKGYKTVYNENKITYNKCSNCGGTGKHYVSKLCQEAHQHVSTSEMSGYTLTKVNCTNCDGTGKLSRSAWIAKYGQNNDYTDYYCLSCHGTGGTYNVAFQFCKHGQSGKHGLCVHGKMGRHEYSVSLEIKTHK